MHAYLSAYYRGLLAKGTAALLPLWGPGGQRRRSLLAVALLAIITTVSSCSSEDTAPASAPSVDVTAPGTIDSIFEIAQQKYLAAATELDTAAGLPRNAWDDGSWRQVKKRDWTTGFFPGILWQVYAHTQDPQLREQAAKWTEVVRENQYFDGNHDIGFMMFSSFGKALENTGDSARYLQPLLTAAETGRTRYDENVGTIRSWNSADSSYLTIVDNMMNLHLYTWAAERTGDETYLDMVRSHADMTDEHHFRPDGGSYHVVDYDPSGDGINRKHTHQGTSDESLWARGQAWAIYGFTEVYQDLGDQRYLDRAVSAADHFIERLPTDTIPYWDFDAPNIPEEEKDASAAAIAASAFLELTRATGNDKYRDEAVRLLNALSSPAYLAGPDDEMGGLLRHQTGNKPGGMKRGGDKRIGEMDVNINYGDYYYLEALNRLSPSK